MTIKNRLLGLSLISVVLSAMALGVFFLAQRPTIDINEERTVIRAVQDQAAHFQAEAARVAYEPLKGVMEGYRTSWTTFSEKVNAVDDLVILPTLNEEMEEAVWAIKGIYDLSRATSNALEGRITDLMVLVEENPEINVNQSMFDAAVVLSRERNNVYDLFVFYAFGVHSSLRELQEIMDVTRDVIDRNSLIIDEEIARVNTQAVILALLSAGVMVLILLVVSMLIGRSVARSVGRVTQGIELMATGNLTGRFDLKGNDEVASLARHFDSLVEKLRTSLRGIGQSARRNRSMKEAMVDSVAVATSSAVEIGANADSIRSQMETMDGMVNEAGRDMGMVTQSVHSLASRIADQGNLVEGASQTVGRVLERLENIGRLMENDRNLARKLSQANEQGREVFEDSFSRIGDISLSIGQIQEMADVIANVASQTNILAMNAAIEAAHAGESGKGFAVVADEIGKLAAEASVSSQEIASTINTIIDEIDDAIATKENTARAFGVISESSQVVAQSMEDLYGHMREIQNASQEVLDIMGRLRADAGLVSGDAGSINVRVSRLNESFQTLSRISHEVVSNIGEISMGLQEINEAIHSVSEQSARLGEEADSLADAVSYYKTE